MSKIKTSQTPQPASSPNKPSRTLHLPSSIISAIQPRTYLLAHLQNAPSSRPSGRLLKSFQPISINTSSLTHCLGSAVVRSGSTAVVCGIQPEILLASDVNDGRGRSRRRGKRRKQAADAGSAEALGVASSSGEIARLGLLVPNVDLGTGCARDHAPGQAPTAAAQSLVQRVYRLLLFSELVDLEDLRITRIVPPEDDADDQDEEEEETIAYFTLHIHFTVLSLDGETSLFSALWTALLAALRDLRLPAARWDADREIVVCDANALTSRKLRLRGLPVACTWGVFEKKTTFVPVVDKDAMTDAQDSWILPDPDAFEEVVCEEVVTVVVDCSARGKLSGMRVLKIEKSGGGIVGRQELGTLLAQAETRWHEVVKSLES